MAVYTPRREASGGPALPTPGFGFPASRTGDSECLLFKPPKLPMAAMTIYHKLGNLYQLQLILPWFWRPDV